MPLPFVLIYIFIFIPVSVFLCFFGVETIKENKTEDDSFYGFLFILLGCLIFFSPILA